MGAPLVTPRGTAGELARTLGLGGASCLHPATAWDPGPAPGISTGPASGRARLSHTLPSDSHSPPVGGAGPSPPRVPRWVRAEVGVRPDRLAVLEALPSVTRVPGPRGLLASRHPLRALGFRDPAGLQPHFAGVSRPQPGPCMLPSPTSVWCGIRCPVPDWWLLASACPPQGQAASSPAGLWLPSHLEELHALFVSPLPLSLPSGWLSGATGPRA